jgi:hypothetical protein
MRANLYRRLGKIEKVAKHLGVSKQSVSKSLKNTLVMRVHEVEDSLPELFAEVPTTVRPFGAAGPGRRSYRMG